MENYELTEPLNTSDLLAQALQALDGLLPEGWSTSLAAADIDPYVDRRRNPDALLEVEAPDRRFTKFAVVAKLTLAGGEVDTVLRNLRQYSEANGTQSLVVSRFLSSTVRDRLRANNVSYVDACGNLSVAAPDPAIALSRPGRSRDPWRSTHTRQQLKGEPAARVVKTLFDLEPPVRIADLIELSGASPGATYRVLDMLVEEGLAEKGGRGWIDSVDRIGMLKRWADDWAAAVTRFALKSTTMSGVDGTLKLLAKQSADSYVLGGGHAAEKVTDIGDVQMAVVYSEARVDRFNLISGLLRPGRNEPDLIVVKRGFAAAQLGARMSGKLRLASPAQAYADLVLIGDHAAAAKLLKKL